MSECTHDCSSCGESCSERKTKESFLEPANSMSKIGKVIGIVSGKGGVGKSLVTSLMASGVQKRGFSTAVLDADITGPSIPKIFGIKGMAKASEYGILPSESSGGVKVMSVNLLLENITDPVVWRGPVIAGTVKQFWTDVIWDDVDYMFVDMPPGTGDVPLTVFQSLPVDGIIVVTSPQELVSMIVGKAVKMAEMMDIPILGIVENMSYLKCPDCGKKISVFGESKIDETAKHYGLDVLGRIPIDPSIAQKCDEGNVEKIDADYLNAAFDAVLKK
ncbi:MAG: Mrp/NBP35 family ATP-binding protein [Eubacteriales bacterium]|nr:Mrp/NBP35 family ATP-binding protein [Eubacteriales bacterium]MDY4212242.1 Mrp/NBP35 family ATP-binding protein [Eubacteriales bacterium]MDY5229854.1 Mrp/NBP35 family ATP-binding protein [Eubacteriales bacterium]